MTDIEALVAEALHETPVSAITTPKDLHVSIRGPIAEAASAFLATPAGQTIARWAAIGEAVERLPDANLTIRQCPTHDEYQWCIAINADGYASGCGPTITAAINAALSPNLGADGSEVGDD